MRTQKEPIERSLHARMWRCALGAALAVCVALTAATTALATGDATQQAACPNEALTGFRTYLPDCRAYELVTPPFSAGVYTPSDVMISPHGNHVIVGQTRGVFANATEDPGSFEMSRTSSGWSVESISPPDSEYIKAGGPPLAASEDLGATLWNRAPMSLSGQFDEAVQSSGEKAGVPTGLMSLYRRESGVMTRIGPDAPALETNFGAVFRGASANLDHVVVGKAGSATGAALYGAAYWPGDTTLENPAHESLYEYSGTANSEPRLVAVTNEGRLEGSPVNAAAHLIASCGAGLGAGAKGNEGLGSTYNAVSGDGTAVFFTVYPGEENAFEPQEGYCYKHFAKKHKRTLPDEATLRASMRAGPYACKGTASGECPLAQREALESKLTARLKEMEGEGLITSVTAPPSCESTIQGECEARVDFPEVKGAPAYELYVRVNEEHTLALSEVEGYAGCTGVCETQEKTPADHRAAVFQGADQAGNEAFFTTTQSLVNEDEGGDGTGNDLYMVAIGSEGGKPKVSELVQVSHVPGEGEPANVQGVVRVSENGAYVYYVATGVLTGANREGREPVAGADNLYAYNVARKENLFVATLMTSAEEASLKAAEAAEPGQIAKLLESLRDEEFAAFFAGETKRYAELAQQYERQQSQLEGTLGLGGKQCSGSAAVVRCGTLSEDKLVWQAVDARPAQATPDGKQLVFVSSRDLVAGDTAKATQVFEYDAEARTLKDVSMGQDAPDVTREGATIPIQSFAAQFDPAEVDTHRALSANGSRVFFESGARLASQGLKGYPNVYESENGHVYLISDGSDRTLQGERQFGVFTTELFGGSLNGGNVFFMTSDQLVPQDGNYERDIYDARAGGGLPAPISAATCQGSACQGGVLGAPQAVLPGSASTQPGGNLKPVATKRKASRKTSRRHRDLIRRRRRRMRRALRRCRHRYRHNRHGRRRCRRRARGRYGAGAARAGRHRYRHGSRRGDHHGRGGKHRRGHRSHKGGKR